MSDWLQALARQLGHFIVTVPIYIAGPAMILIGALDSSLLSLPEVNDYLVVARCYTHPRTVFFFPMFAAAGSVLGCWLLYTILQRGGIALLHRRFKVERVERVERAYARFGILALAVPALLPPPLPFKVFVATAGTLEYPRCDLILFGRIVTCNQNRGCLVFSPDLFLHRLQRNLDTTTARWFVNADDLERPVKELNCVADVGFAVSLPLRIDDRFVTRLQWPPFAHRHSRNLRVLVVFDPIDQTLAKPRITAVDRLADWSGCTHAGDRCKFCSV